MEKTLQWRGQHLLVPTTLQVKFFYNNNIHYKYLFVFIYFIARIDSYRLVYSTSPNDIIDENGFVDANSVRVNETDVISGSLTPLDPGSAQIVTINLHRTPEVNPPPLYFTIGSVLSNGGPRVNLNRKIIS